VRTAPRRSRRLRALIPRENLAATLYGTILATSVIATLPGAERPAIVIAALLVTAVVFALAHAWAHVLARSARERAPVTRSAVAAGIKHEWPMVEAALPASAVVALALLDVYSIETALWAATAVNTLLLFVWGAVVRRISGGSTWISLRAGLAAASLGVALAALKYLIH
jgi:hypothetical protein